jgi:hypothetical protein
MDRSLTGVLSLSVAFALAGCSGSQPPIATPGAMPQSHADAWRPGTGSWALPEASGDDLVYVTSLGKSVLMYSYPEGQLVGSITGLTGIYGECADNSGNIFVISQTTLYEYAHGGTTPIAEISIPASAVSCAIDATSGNVAIVTDNALYVYPGQQGPPSEYLDDSFENMASATYDDSGNLFLSGTSDPSRGFLLAELPTGAGALKTITTPISNSFGTAAVQWDGQYLAVATRPRDKGNGHLYQLGVSGSSAYIIHSYKLKHGKIGTFITIAFSLQGDVMALPIAPHTLGFWKYPQAGSPQQTIKVGIRNRYLNAPVFSTAPSH